MRKVFLDTNVVIDLLDNRPVLAPNEFLMTR